MSAEEIPALKEAYTQATMQTWSKKELEIYEYWQMRDATDRLVMESQFKKGVEKVAYNLKQAGVAIEVIMQTTGLTQAEIDQLRCL